jgi:serine/threonine protein kinase
MSWPLASHFSAMLQNPSLAFRDPTLRECRIAKDERNQPRPWSGAFAVVYKAISAADQRPFAVRIFTTESPERRERYHEISAYLKTRKLKCLVDFEYRDESIRSTGDGKWYPLILMDWVEGQTLFKWTRARALEGDGTALAEAARRWVALVKEMDDARIAHGDLQHANVMVTGTGELKLVDYDCMCVPSLVGRRNLEVGVEPYQHPERDASTHLSLDLDHFSALVIYVALRALSLRPSLWVQYVEAPEHDKLLFRKEDFDQPRESPLVRDLLALPDVDARDLVGRLLDLARAPMNAVPPLSELANSYAKIESLLRSEQWEETVDLLNRRGQFRDAPKHLQPLIHQAYEHHCRARAWRDFTRIQSEKSELHDRRLVNVWNEALFAGFEPAEKQRERIDAARRRVRAIDRLHLLVQKSPQATSLEDERTIVAEAARLPGGYKFGLEVRVERARRAVDAVRWLEQAVAEDVDDVAIATMWKKVVDAEAKRLVPREHHLRIELALRRASRLLALRRLTSKMPADKLDRRLLEIWDEELLANCPAAERWRVVYNQAIKRRAGLEKVGDAISRCADPELLELVDGSLLAGYPLPPAWQAVVDQARQRTATMAVLEKALAGHDRKAFVEAFDARLIRRYSDRLQPYQAMVLRWTESEVLAADVMGLQPAVGRASLAELDSQKGTYRVRWTWPLPRFSDECLLAVVRERPNDCDTADDHDVLCQETIDRTSWETGGGSRTLEADSRWEGCYAVVWASIDLGYRRYWSEPLVLGRFSNVPARAASGRRGWRLFGGLEVPDTPQEAEGLATPEVEPEGEGV